MHQSLPFGLEFFQSTPDDSLRLSVIVPAKNEALFIVQALEALRLQVDRDGVPIDPGLYEVLVLANNCNDDTYSICQAYQQQYPSFALHIESVQLETEHAHIGTARRLLMDAAFIRLMHVAGRKGIIVSTDADSEVAADWVHHILREIDQGADVIGGRILPRNTPEVSRRHHLRDVTYRFLKSRLESTIDPQLSNPWPRHFQCYGPSLAVTCEMYEKAGRLPVIPFLEDEEFRKALKRIDSKIRNSPHVRIYTSGRLDGRVKFGFSVQLQQWSEMSLKCEEQKVETLRTLIFKFEFKNRLRAIWNAKFQETTALDSLNSLSLWAKVNYSSLLGFFSDAIYFESLWEQVEQALENSKHPAIELASIDSVISALRMHFHQHNKPSIRKLDVEQSRFPEALVG